MVFNSVFFFATLALLLLVYFPLVRHGSYLLTKVILLVYGLFFYSIWNPIFVVPLLLTLTIDYWAAARIAADPPRKKLYLAASLVSNLGMLGFFKYGQLVASSLAALARALGVPVAAPHLDVDLPIGISFYTFLSLSYTLDVYWGRFEPEPTPLNFALFITYFPHLVAGPIVRAKHFVPQLHERPRFSARDFADGAFMVVVGLFLKCVLADNVSARANVLFASWRTNGALDTWAAAMLFGVQIYGDFAGYSLIAIGIARAMGFDFTPNFAAPYGALGFSEFWTRWHISLSSWLRDYLYVPLGGNRRGPRRTYVNLMVTMLLGGLWHGASYMFLVWGGLHGAYLCLERLAQARVDRLRDRTLTEVFGTALTFVVISVTWIPFRAADWSQCRTMLLELFALGRPLQGGLGTTLGYAALIAAVFAAHYVSARRPLLVWIMSRPLVRDVAMTAMLVALYFFSGQRSTFIYFQF
jgi:alginate O-acetyltransferase complex protein AlgI